MKTMKRMAGRMKCAFARLAACARDAAGAVGKAIGYALSFASAMALAGPSVLLASAGSYTAPLENLKTVLITISGAAGAVLIVYGAIRFAIAFQKMDQNGEHSAIYTIIAGAVLGGISVVLGVLGV